MTGSRALFLAAALAVPASAAAQSVSGAPDIAARPDLMVRARPQVDPALWFTDDDYPPAAMRAEQEGRVSLLVDVDSSGRVSGCAILAASGAPFLDQTSCGIVTRRARFVPALGRDRATAPDRWTINVTWKLPPFASLPQAHNRCDDCGMGFVDKMEVPAPRTPAVPSASAWTVTAAPDVAPAKGGRTRASPLIDPSLWLADGDYPPSAIRAEQDGRTGVLLEIASDGHVDTCSILSSSKVEPLDRASCRILSRRVRFTPARGRDGKPTADRWNVSIDWKLPTDVIPVVREPIASITYAIDSAGLPDLRKGKRRR